MYRLRFKAQWNIESIMGEIGHVNEPITPPAKRPRRGRRPTGEETNTQSLESQERPNPDNIVEKAALISWQSPLLSW